MSALTKYMSVLMKMSNLICEECPGDAWPGGWSKPKRPLAAALEMKGGGFYLKTENPAKIIWTSTPGLKLAV